MNGIFEKAVMTGLTFNTERGVIFPQDLRHVPLTSEDGFNLNDIAKGLNREVKGASEESFVAKKTEAGAVAQLSLDIVKRIIEIKLEARDRATAKLKDTKRNEALLARLEEIENEDIGKMSKEDLLKEIG